MKHSFVILLATCLLASLLQAISIHELEKCQYLLKKSNKKEITFSECLQQQQQMTEWIDEKENHIAKSMPHRNRLSTVQKRKENEKLYQIFSKMNRLSGMRKIGRAKTRSI